MKNNQTPNTTVFPAFSVCIVYRYCDGIWPVFLCVCVCVYEWLLWCVVTHICIDGRLPETPKVLLNLHIRSPEMLYLLSYCYCVCVITESFKLHQTAIGIQCCLRIKLKKTFFPCCCI